MKGAMKGWWLLPALALADLPDRESFRVTALPGLEVGANGLNFTQYAGYMPLNDDSGTELFFWFVTSQRSPSTDPLAIWMNGGPGSSSVAYGFWTEHGPFRLRGPTGQVELYPYSWNRIANVIYLEAPSGVGYSYSADQQHYHPTDNQTSWDNYQFLLNFFKVFPEFQKNDFYVTGESYGGHYVPQLSERILDNPNSINMKGFLIGNPGINSDWYYNVNEYAFTTYMWSHALLPLDAYQKMVTACGWGDFFTDCKKDFTHPNAECTAAAKAAWNYMPEVWDPYNVFAPTCQTDGRGHDFVAQYTPGLEAMRQKYNVTSRYNPCINDWTPPYMNRPDVIKAIHADKHYNREWPRHPKGWEYGSELADIALLFPKFRAKAPEWKILVVSGDADAAVPFMGTERWMNCLGRPVVKDWTNWMLNGDVAGSVKVWDQFQFVTVKGCGHTIPTYCPEAGYAFWENWMKELYPSESW